MSEFVITAEDNEKHGCPYCNFRSSYDSISQGNSHLVTCGECSKGYMIIVGMVGDESTLKMNGKAEYAQPHPLSQNLARGKKDERPDDGGEYFGSRGIGLELVDGCAFCDNPTESYIPNISGYIRTKAAGERLLEWFKVSPALVGKPHKRIGAYLDYRELSPDYVQFKIGACEEHKPNLELLHDLTRLTKTITPDYLQRAKGLNNFPKEEALLLYMNTRLKVSEDYFKEDEENNFQRGKIDSYKEILWFIDRYKENYKDESGIS